MSGPYGITQVDVPGALNVLEQARSNRIRSMMLQRQMDQDERAEERQTGIQTALARFAGQAEAGKGGAPTGMAGAYAAPRSANAPYYVSPDTPAQPSASAATPPAAGDRNALIRDLLVIDPEQATQIQQVFARMDDAAHQQSERANTALGREAQFMLTLDPSQWAAELQGSAQRLIEAGVPRERIEPYLNGQQQLTAQTLQSIVAQARDIEKIREETRPHPMVEPQGGRIIDTNTIDPATGRPRVISESPTVEVGGVPYARPPSMTTAPRVGEIRNGRPFLGGDPSNPQSWGPRQGGQSPGSGGFPRRSGTLTIDRNNNPGALRVPGSDRFRSFASPAAGVRAQENQLRRYHGRGIRTVSDIVETYAPRASRGGDNTDAQVNNYIRHVSSQLGVSPNQTIPPERIPELAEAMRGFETGRR